MKIELTMQLIKSLQIGRKPVGVDAKGGLLFEDNPDKKDYIVWDASQEAPPGFGVRVSAKKTFVLRRKVNGKSMMPTVGNVADFADKAPLALARAKAAEMALEMVSTGANPKAEARKRLASELTLGAAFGRYLEHMVTRTERPASDATQTVIKRARAKFAAFGWADLKLRDLDPDEIKKKFMAGKSPFPAANEQAFRWGLAAARWNVETEMLAAGVANRAPLLRVNPFSVLLKDSCFRSRATVEEARKLKNMRNPLTPSKTMGEFLEAAWSKKDLNNNEGGIHYLILMLLWGCRKSEHAPCKWAELLGADERRVTSHVALDDPEYGPYVFFHKTKNRSSHRLPLAPMALELLRRRQASAAADAAHVGFERKSRKFVFPAKNKTSKMGHYSDASDLLDSVREEAGIARLTRHDLRRSFGAMMETIEVPDGIRKRFFNHADANVTDTYSKAEWALLREWIGRIEQEILSRGPNVYNALKPVDWPMLPAPEPHVCQPAKPRSGRPRKEMLDSQKVSNDAKL